MSLIINATISQATFGLSINEHKAIKSIGATENLDDHLTPVELVFKMLGETSATEISKKDDAHGFTENEQAAQKGGKVAGDARRALELQSDRPVVSSQNALGDNRS